MGSCCMSDRIVICVTHPKDSAVAVLALHPKPLQPVDDNVGPTQLYELEAGMTIGHGAG